MRRIDAARSVRNGSRPFGEVDLLDGLHSLLARSPAPRAIVTSSIAATLGAAGAMVAASLIRDEPKALADYRG